jgi:hypothetical protein
MICVLHTFGRDLKWNPHIHMILSEEAVGSSNIWKWFGHINYEGLRHSWRYCLLKLMLEEVSDPAFKGLVDMLYNKYKDGFYVNAPPIKNFSAGLVNYIVRYAGRPVLAQSRITGYDGEYVTFTYTPHDSDELVSETLPVFDFIKKLIIHIPDRYFRMIRYYGFYSVRSSKHQQYLRREKRIEPCTLRKLRKIYGSWRERIKQSFLYDPIKCTCGTTMELLDILKSSRAAAFYLAYWNRDTS